MGKAHISIIAFSACIEPVLYISLFQFKAKRRILISALKFVQGTAEGKYKPILDKRHREGMHFNTILFSQS